MLDRLWNEYFNEECAVINTDEERTLLRRVVEFQEAAIAGLTKDQREGVQRYVEVLYESQGAQVKKAFLKGCEFTASFFFELGILTKE